MSRKEKGERRKEKGERRKEKYPPPPLRDSPCLRGRVERTGEEVRGSKRIKEEEIILPALGRGKGEGP